jgi:hypothetical protein
MNQKLKGTSRAERFIKGSGGQITRSLMPKAQKLIDSPARYDFKREITEADLCKKYKLAGIEWGNWVQTGERLNYLVLLKQAFKDLHDLGFKNLGFDNKLGIAIGSRGISNSLAHFNGTNFVINLNKNFGDQSLGHEYGHALDSFFGLYIDQDPKNAYLSGNGAKRFSENEMYNVNSIRGFMNNLINKINSDENYWNNINEQTDVLNGEYYTKRAEIFARFFEVYLSKNTPKNKFLQKSAKYYNDNPKLYVNDALYKKVLPIANQLFNKMKSYLK